MGAQPKTERKKDMSGEAERYSHLLAPIRIAGHTYRSRVVSAPRGGIWNEDPECHDADPEQLAEIDLRAGGGQAAFLVGETPVTAAGGRGANEFYGFDDQSEEHTRRYRQFAQRIHDNGALALVELCHVGQAKSEIEGEEQPIGPMELTNGDGVFIRAMTEEDVEQLCADFVKAARFCQEAGFDGVCLHCGHGWLFHQFLSPRTNQRIDRFGGSLENRSRLSVMVLQALREACGREFILECRVSGSEHVPGGYSLEDICGYCRYLSQYADLIHVSAGLYQDPSGTWQESTLYEPHGCNADVAAAIRAVVDIPVAVVGGINSPEQAEELIAQGKCDLVVLCRQLTADPFFTQKVREGRAEEIRRCLRCMRCYPGPFEEAWAELNGQFPEGCSINPCADHPERWRVEPAEEKKTVLIVGGGVAGLQAAVTARDRGHDVVLLEKSGQLGGILNFSVHDPDKNDLAGFARAMEAQARAKGADLRLNTVLTGERLADIRPDEVILAIGSHPLLPPIPGLDGANVVQAMDAYAPDTRLGHKVVVLGGGLVGCETAVHLWKQGHEVELVEMREELAPDAYRLHKRRLRELIAQHVKAHMGARCLAVTEAGVQVEGPDGSVQLIPADTVAVALGMRANDTGELEALVQRAGVPCHKIGDCVRARKIYDAVSEGYLTALSL